VARHSVFTIIAEISSPEDERELDRLLKHRYDRTAFANIDQLHFACFVIFPSDRLVDEGCSRPVKSKLVLECNVDGPVAPFLQQLADHPICDDVFRHCDGYPAVNRPAATSPSDVPLPGSEGAREARIRFLSDHVRRPNLYHIGAPYRSARSIRDDLELRRDLDRTMAATVADSLECHLTAAPSGIREYWWSDVVRPWLAWILGIGGPAAALWVGSLTWQFVPLPSAARVVFLFAYAVVALVSVLDAFKTWMASPPDLRERVWPWIQWTVLGVAWLAAARWIAVRDPMRGLLAAGIFVALTAHRVWTASARRTNERLQEIRSNSAAPPLDVVWRALRAAVRPREEKPKLRERVGHWAGWLIAYGGTVLLAYATRRPAWLFLVTIALVFLAKGVWLAILLGWPADQGIKDPQDRARIRWFVAAVPAIAVVAFAILRSLSASPWLLGAAMLAVLFSLWVMPLPSPEPAYTELAAEQLATLTDEEDRDVQNHMAALVVLRRDRRYRRPALRVFLFLLNRLFFRAWLPDLYRGKLFGIPTVHFAQWVLLDDRNYLFLSNYDNSWTTYLDDFGRRLETGIQKIWGQGERNPGTKDLARFKSFARTTMVGHALWCRNYAGVTLRQQWNNEQIRRALVRSTGEEQMIAALRRFGAAPKTLPDFSHGRVN
jgi:hypothetical protein